jgi:hypothetical protein
MAYKVIKPFIDLQDNGHVYNAGDDFPREGLEVSDERIQQLITVNNNARQVFIKKVGEYNAQEEVNEFPKHTGGGWYLLSNGEKVQGKDEAVEAEKALKAGE